jgi:phosphoribosylaminoimidazolecarboxamide formyltransferase/IMP cyclohydrolase
MALNVVEKMDEFIRIRNVIISTYDKSGLDVFVKNLLEINPEVKLYSTGNTYATLKQIFKDEIKNNLIAIADFTGQPEMQGGLVKTLDFKIYLGLLSETYNDAHCDDLDRVKGVAFDMVVSNLYPFQNVVKQGETTAEIARSYIDIGGPCMIRAAAKNFIRVVVVTDKNDYGLLKSELQKNNGSISLELRFELAKKAFLHTAQYDTAISEYLINREFDEIAACYNRK